MTLSPTTIAPERRSPAQLAPATLALLLDFCEVRYNTLCEYLLADAELHRHSVREEANLLVGELRRAARWAAVPTPLVVAVEDTVETARRMWEQDGQTVSAVRQFVERATPPEHIGLVLEEAYRDALASDEYPRLATATPASPLRRAA